MQKYNDVVLGQNGTNLAPIPNASVTVLTSPGGALATIYSDNGITITANPLTTDASGRFSFYAANGRYSLNVAYLNVSYALNDVPLEDDPVQQTIAPSYTGGVSRQLSSKVYDVVSVLDFGADPTGSADSTTAFNNALACSRKILVPAGTYAIQQVTIPSNTVMLGEGKGRSVLQPVVGTADGILLSSSSTSNVEIGELSINVSKVSFPTMYAIRFDTVANGYLHDLLIPNGGVVGISTNNCTDILVERSSVSNCANRCIEHAGASAARCRTRNCYVSNPGGVDHGISCANGVDHEVSNNYVTLCTVFGISIAFCQRVLVSGNKTYNTTREGINATDSQDVTVTDNIAAWDTTTSQDFGMSFAGQSGAGTNFAIIRGNKIINCGKSGIALASASLPVTACTVQGNLIENSNRLNLGNTNGGGAGVILYGLSCQNNFISENKIYDTIGFLQYAVYEWNSGGLPAANRFFSNFVSGNASSVTNITANSLEALTTLDAVSYTPTIAATAGALTTASATGNYILMGKLVYIRATGSITTNGTGSGSITISLPFTVTSTPAASTQIIAGKETGVSNKAVIGTTSQATTTLTITFYDGTYPGANGASISVAGWYVRT
jgi:hypothetical protein